MVRLGLTILVYLVLAGVTRGVEQPQPVFDEFDVKLIKFNDAWNRYYRKHFNCSPEAIRLSDCRLEMGQTVDYSGYLRVAKEGWKLFSPVLVERGKKVPCEGERQEDLDPKPRQAQPVE